MTNETRQELTRIREALVPAAEELKSVAGRIPQKQEFADQTNSDLKKIVSYAKEFRRDVTRYFPTENEIPDLPNELGDFLSTARHDSRNRLNHLFNLVQLLGLSKDYEAIKPSLGEISVRLNKCLSILTVNPGSEAKAPPPQSEPLRERHPHPGVVLIADDDEENRHFLARLLEPAGHTLHFAKDGVEAIDKIDKTVFDAVLLDIQMPKMDGFEVLASLRQSGHLGQTPVIVLTGLQEEQDAVRCIEIGAEDFLSRPIRSPLLMARLNASLEKKRLREQVFEQYFTRN